MRFNLIPREMKFFDMFDEAAVILTRAAGKLLDLSFITPLRCATTPTARRKKCYPGWAP
jgi:hypothetical protein